MWSGALTALIFFCNITSIAYNHHTDIYSQTYIFILVLVFILILVLIQAERQSRHDDLRNKYRQVEKRMVEEGLFRTKRDRSKRDLVLEEMRKEGVDMDISGVDNK